MIVRGDLLVRSSLDIAGTVIVEAAAAPTATSEDLLPEFDSGQTRSPLNEAMDGSPSSAVVTVVPEPDVGLLWVLAAATIAVRHRRDA